MGFPKRSSPILHEMLWGSFRSLGWQPDIVCEVIGKSTMLRLVGHGIGIALSPAWVKSLSSKSLKFVPYYENAREIDLYISYRTSGDVKEALAFFDAVKYVSGEATRS
ncbi:LysR substrate binding domain-containing protein [Shimia abyssi]|uniref:LysR substrate binding domain-containing protein n=2 Tax=Shimia abyssi TaxID=1662395 RepID=A0A2P8F9F0_9RHOB|nr:LysR substrate binding domain-containing protein [Shimia abyssi]